VSLTIATGTDVAVSEAAKSRPATNGISIVLKNLRRDRPDLTRPHLPSAGRGWSARQVLVPMHDPGGGMHEAPATLRTPGSAATRDNASRKKSVDLAGCIGRPGVARRREDALGAVSEVDVLQLDEAAQQQPGAGQQHERERDFGDDRAR
jgi:hypothetical protein